MSPDRVKSHAWDWESISGYGSVAWEIPRPAKENAGFRDDVSAGFRPEAEGSGAQKFPQGAYSRSGTLSSFTLHNPP